MFKKMIYFSLIVFLIISSSSLILAQNTDLNQDSAEDVFSEALDDYNQKNYTSAAEKFNLNSASKNTESSYDSL
jgi:outer membrane protein assembly factor BamD (BamD/ComL family)